MICFDFQKIFPKIIVYNEFVEKILHQKSRNTKGKGDRLMLALKNTKKVLLAGLIMSSMASGSLFTNSYASPAISADANRSITITDPSVLSDSLNLKKYIRTLHFLTENEKQQLLQTEEQTKPLYDQIDEIYDQIEKISDRILADSEHWYEEADKIHENQAALWKKLFENVTEKQNQIQDNKEFIRMSAALTMEEKAILIQEQERLDAVYMKLDQQYDLLEQETKTLYEKIDALYRQIRTMDAKNDMLWEKIYDNDKTFIPY